MEGKRPLGRKKVQRAGLRKTSRRALMTESKDRPRKGYCRAHTCLREDHQRERGRERERVAAVAVEVVRKFKAMKGYEPQ